MCVRLKGMIKHTRATIRSDERTEEGFLGDFWVIFVGFKEGFDVVESVGLSKALNGDFLGVARRNRGFVAIGYGGVDLQGLVWVEF